MSEKDSAMDYPEHEKTFALFMTMTKYGTVSVIVILVLMALFLL
ncbi:MAG: aa3-type cytochrome c oxidase subunit IV [Pseudomonadota bacterium]